MAVPTPPGNFVIEFESQEDSATEAGGDTDYSINMPGLGTYPILLVDSTTQLESETQSITCISETPLALQPQVSTIDDNDSGDNNDNNTNSKSVNLYCLIKVFKFERMIIYNFFPVTLN